MQKQFFLHFMPRCSKIWYRACFAVLGMLGGFPLGATVACELYTQGKITKRQGEYLCAFTNNPSLSFMLSYVGGIFGDRRLGVLLAILCFVCSAFVAIAFKYLFLNKEERDILLVGASSSKIELADAIKDGGITMVVICACVVFFGSISRLLPMNLRGFLEISGGMEGCNSPVQAAVLLGFSGFSVMCQVAVVCKRKLSLAPFIGAKLMQSAVMGICAYFLFD